MLVTHERYFFLMSPPVKPWPLFSSKVSYAGADNISLRQNGIVRTWEQTGKLFGRLASRFNIIQRRGGLDRGRDGGEARAQCHILPGIVAHASMARIVACVKRRPRPCPRGHPCWCTYWPLWVWFPGRIHNSLSEARRGHSLNHKGPS